MTQSPRTPPSVALVGIHGHGTSHLRTLLAMQATGEARIAALVDPAPPTAPPRLDGHTQRVAPEHDLSSLPWYPDLADLLARAPAPDVVIVCTPIHTHAAVTAQALRAGSDVLLEKPPTGSLTELTELLAVVQETGRSVQVGFQTFGSAALPALHRIVASGEIGEVTGIGGVGTWVRPRSYWTRSAWTGRRTLAGRPVVDGVVTNPLAHAVATALHLAGARTVHDVTRVELDQYRANDIEVDDTSAVRITTSTGVVVSLGLTLCAATHSVPTITIQGTLGQASLDYYTDTVEVTTAAGSRTFTSPRTHLLTDLLSHRVDRTSPLLSPLEGTGAFQRVLDAVRTAPDPTPVPAEHVREVTDDLGTHLVVDDVEDWCTRVATEHATFAELGAPWARTRTARPTGASR
ncbi:Gfo/Idh/MocA family protein [Actinotalea sp. K2]|uniref:Gfo/Idh/MocA family protein n=1 Tax=Actinotalea sp. K2 TaxID=2939438 RepID=UPI002016D379|nr:Gfo/Idh/MocA family oxidoreductase [Actinotalea sp. K2]MCL3859401.1 Gfo/Idh/MocA family oxidoreductase [Actinotalea sp. K2]